MIDLIASVETEVDIDFSDEIAGLTSVIVLARKVNEQWAEINIAGLRNTLDEQALAITESKEEYLRRRKDLAGTVRDFKQRFASCSDDVDVLELKNHSNCVIDVFKAEYDHLSSICKAAEAAYLNMYKTFRDAPDPHELAALSVSAAEGALDGFARVDAVFAQLESSQHEQAKGQLQVHQQGQGGEGGGKAIKSDEEFQDRLQVGMAEVASSYEAELRRREQILRDTFEHQKLQAQQTFDSILAQKDAELQSLNETLLSQQQAASWASEHQAQLQAEVDRREEAEERARRAARECEELRGGLQESRARLEEQDVALVALRRVSEEQARGAEDRVHEARVLVEQQQDELVALRRALSATPSLDLAALAAKLGVPGHEPPPEGHTLESSRECPVQWPDVEEWLVATVRKAQSDASAMRARDHERQEQWDQLEARAHDLAAELEEKRRSVASLEQDLTQAYSSIEAGKALLQCHGMAAAQAGGAVGAFVPGGSSGRSGGGGGGGEKDVAMMKAVLEQRDRAIKQAHTQQQEVGKLQARAERLDNDKATLKSENTELYKRLRVMRVNSGVSAAASTAAAQSSHVKKRSTGADWEGASEEGGVEAKYALQYEQQLDVFQLEALDRQAAQARLNVCEQGLTHLVRFVTQDRWIRHALLVYLLVVHAFALGYVLTVLNPDIEREIDEQWSRISKEELNHDVMHPDNWA